MIIEVHKRLMTPVLEMVFVVLVLDTTQVLC